MRSLRSFPTAFICLLLVLGSTARSQAQSPAPYSNAHHTIDYEQTDATTVHRQRILLMISVDAPTARYTDTVEIRHPSGKGYRLRQSYTGINYAQFTDNWGFNSWEELRAMFPTGTWSVVVLIGNSVTQINQVRIDAVTEQIPKVSNYDEIQQFAGGRIRFVWGDMPADTTPPQRQLIVTRWNGQYAFVGGMPGSVLDYDFQDRIPAGETVDAKLTTTRLNTSSVLNFKFKRVPDTPEIARQPSDVTVAEGGRIALTVSATGPSIRYQWLKDGVAVSGATTSSLEIASAKLSDAGAYTVRITNDKGEVVSNVARVLVNQIIIPPTITAEPASVVATAGAQAQFRVAAAGTSLAYQWHRNSVALPGATSATLTLANVRAADAGSYTVTVSNASGSTSSAPATLSVDPVTRISNLSIRTMAGGEAGLLTVGLTLGGESGAAAKPVLLRAIGPTLSVFGVAGTLPDPSLAVLSGPTIVVRNDNWSGNTLVASVSTQVGAFGIPDTSSKDAALVFPASAGSYTMQIDGSPGGVALAEIYDATPGDDFTITTLRLTNVSALTEVGTGGDILIAGFSIAGTKPRTVLIRAVGPGLAAFGVSAPLGDPQLELYRGGVATPHAANDNWGSAANATDIATAATRVGAFALTAGGRDAAILVSLLPGSYTAQVSGIAGATGKALVEVYEVP